MSLTKGGIKMNQNKSEKTKSLRYFHAVIAALSALGILAVLFMEDWGEMTVWFPIAVAVFFDGKFEKTDELAKQNLGKANTVTMWVLFAAFIFFGMFARFHAISMESIMIVIFSALAVRSILFSILDMSFLGGAEESDG